jgi:hypothetical protein
VADTLQGLQQQRRAARGGGVAAWRGGCVRGWSSGMAATDKDSDSSAPSSSEVRESPMSYSRFGRAGKVVCDSPCGMFARCALEPWLCNLPYQGCASTCKPPQRKLSAAPPRMGPRRTKTR